jgi:hypothetical protein
MRARDSIIRRRKVARCVNLASQRVGPDTGPDRCRFGADRLKTEAVIARDTAERETQRPRADGLA